MLLNEQNQKEDTKGFPFNRPGMLTAPRVTTHPYHDRLIIKSSKRAKKNISIDNDHLSPNFSLSQRIELVPLFHSLLSPLSFSLLSLFSLFSLLSSFFSLLSSLPLSLLSSLPSLILTHKQTQRRTQTHNTQQSVQMHNTHTPRQQMK